MSSYEDVGAEIVAEILRARTKHAPMRGAHEGYAVLLEEVDELWDEVKRRHPDLVAMRKKAIQIAAMGLAFAVEVCDAPAPSAPKEETRVECFIPIETTAGRCFACVAEVLPTRCAACGQMHVGTYCWPCHHKNYPDGGCASPFCPEHSAPRPSPEEKP